MIFFYYCINYIFRHERQKFLLLIITSKYTTDKNNVLTFGTGCCCCLFLCIFHFIFFPVQKQMLKSRSLHCQMIATANECEMAKSDIIYRFLLFNSPYISFSSDGMSVPFKWTHENSFKLPILCFNARNGSQREKKKKLYVNVQQQIYREKMTTTTTTAITNNKMTSASWIKQQWTTTTTTKMITHIYIYMADFCWFSPIFGVFKI